MNMDLSHIFSLKIDQAFLAFYLIKHKRSHYDKLHSEFDQFLLPHLNLFHSMCAYQHKGRQHQNLQQILFDLNLSYQNVALQQASYGIRKF